MIYNKHTTHYYITRKGRSYTITYCYTYVCKSYDVT